MWAHGLPALALVLGSCLSAGAQSQFQTQFANFEVQQLELPRGRSAVVQQEDLPRGRSAGQAQPPRAEQRESTTPVPILKQINEHNEDGSYTYGYEAADGTFKLETRFPDGSVQGKYGYVDVNGDVKIIQYGADAMGFQPQGDLPEGIIIPPPVSGNCTDCGDYDYDGGEEAVKEQERIQVANRPREQPVGRPASKQLLQLPSQNRGQDLDQPITPPPQPRRPTQPSSFDEAVLSDIFTPIPVRDFPQPVAPLPQAPFAPAPQFAAAPIRESVRTAAIQPAAAASEGFSNFPTVNNPARGRTRLAIRPVAAGDVAGGQSQPVARVPIRSGQATARQVVTGTRPVQRPAASQQLAAEQPSFSSFPAAEHPTAASPIVPAFLPAQSPSRPALTFQDDRVAARSQPPPAALPLATPTTLPASALEIVDFNQLLQEFQGSQQQQPGRARFAGDQQNQFPVQQQQHLVPAFQQAGRFSTDNFPVRF